MKRLARGAALASLVAMLPALLATAAPATVFRSGESVVVGSDEVLTDDLYISGATVDVEGTVEGDLVFAGGQLNLRGRVAGDLIGAGQAIVISGEVGDDVRIAGMALKLESGAAVGDDVFAAGFSFESEAGSRIGGNALLVGYQARLAGEVEEGLDASVVGLELDGGVAGDVEAEVESEAGPAWWIQFMQSPVAMPEVDGGLTLGSEARIGGDLHYVSEAEARIAPGAALVGAVRHERPQRDVPVEDEHEVEAEVEAAGPSLAERAGRALRRFVALLIVGLVLLWLARGRLEAVAAPVERRPLPSLGWGLVVLAALPVAGVAVAAATGVLMIVFGLTSLGPLVWLALVLGLVTLLLLIVGSWLAVGWAAPLAVAYAVGGRLTARATGRWSRHLGLAAGLAIVVVLAAIPYLGVLAKWVVALLGLGALALSRAGSRASPPAA